MLKKSRLAVALGAAVAVTVTVTVALALTPINDLPVPGTLFSSVRPQSIASNDAAPVTLGVRIAAKKSGRVTGARYFKGAGNTGKHVAAIYSQNGDVLVQAPFTRETASGWQTATFPSPVRINADTEFVIAVHMPAGHYYYAKNYQWPVETPALTAVGGVYAYGQDLQFPSSVWKSTNYFIDPMFLPDRRGRESVSVSPQPTSPEATTQSPPASASPTSSEPLKAWPDETNTGVAGCPDLHKVRSGGRVTLKTNGEVLENTEFLDETTINVQADNVTIRCVKLNGVGWYGIDNTDRPSSVVVDRVDISCQDKGQVVGLLLRNSVVSRVNVHNCDHMINAGGDNLTIRDSYCHSLTDKEVVHADCIQSLGGNNNLNIEHNSLWTRDTSAILLGQEYGEARNVVINNNRLMSHGTPPPAYLLYLSGTNTVVTNNRFTRRFSYGHCTLNTANPYTWRNNVWDDDGRPIKSC